MNGETVKVYDIRLNGSNRVLSSVQANKLLNQGSEAFLAYEQISKIRTVCEFSNVFSKELLGLPPDR
ncbi:RVP_2 domain-containing protein [Gossypium australe]|uniref:RVP_2 domain-containing protein n=1 Tax=Gossypium australe TaxID=47621 RepID=A0A5B6X4C5_9ROSI|nr:RVP_2 domain-containing protein [Gossypium australe]